MIFRMYPIGGLKGQQNVSSGRCSGLTALCPYGHIRQIADNHIFKHVFKV